MPDTSRSMEEHRGYIRKVIATWPSGDILADFEVETRAGMVPMKVTGPFDKFVRPGDWFLMKGKVQAKEYKGVVENRFVTRDIMPDLPRTVEGVLGLLDKTFNMGDHGIEPAARKAFADKHGPNAAFKIEKNPALLLEMSSNPKRFEKDIKLAWDRRISALTPVRLMEAAGAKPEVVNAVMKKFRDETLDVIKTNPYALMAVKLVDFKLADRFAEKIGIAKSDPRRVSAAVSEVISASLSDGNTYIPIAGIKSALGPFDVEWDSFKELATSVADKRMAERLGVTIFKSKVGNVAQRYDTYRSERDIALSVRELVERGKKMDHARIGKVAERVLGQDKYSFLSAEQRAAVMTCSRESIAILTGGPGTGKSTVSDAIAEIAIETIKGPLYLVAPTGKAARRLAQATERDAMTVHKLLGSTGELGQFKHGIDNKLEAGCFVLVDEASMLDTNLTRSLLAALPEDGRILFVGDKDQLPSVDAGYVIGDMLTAMSDNGNTVPSAELTEVFRSKGSNNLIAPYAKDMKEGKFDVSLVNHRTIGSSGIAFFEFQKESIIVQVEKVYCDLAERVLQLDPRQDVIVLCPMRKGRGGTHEINTRLQAKANPNGAKIADWVRPAGMDPEDPTPRVGDRVMLTTNDDKLGIRNGDVGYIRRVVTEWAGKRSFAALEIVLESEDIVKIPVSQAPYCTTVAYAITGHKSQGSQYKCVIMPVSPDHVSMMERTLLYTEWTRAKRYVVLIGDKETFAAGLENTASSQRMTLLKYHIEDELNNLPAPAVRPARKTPGTPASAAKPSQPVTVEHDPEETPVRRTSGPPPFIKAPPPFIKTPPPFIRPTQASPQSPSERPSPPFAGGSGSFRVPTRG